MTHLKTPSRLDFPVYLVNFPLRIHNTVINNALMEKYRGVPYDYDMAYRQFMELYTELTTKGLVYILPSVGTFQDQTYVANLGCYLPHLQQDTILLANFKSEPRIGEDQVGLAFFRQMGYTVLQPQTTFEGEADLKFLRDDIYIGGYGIRTDKRSYYWLMDHYGGTIIPVEMSDECLYHFDCMFLALTHYKALVATCAMKKADLRQLEHYVEIIDVPQDYVYDAWTNSLMYGSEVLHMEISKDSDRAFVNLMVNNDFEPVLINLSEFEKSGAALSCMLLHLNHLDRD